MANTRDIRRRIKSVRNTAQITKAMQMVAASKMRKAQQAALSGRPYASLMCDALSSVVHNAGGSQHPLLEVRPVRRQAVIVVSPDKGLCGGLTANVMREVAKYDPTRTVFIAVGRKASQFLARTRRTLLAEFNCHDAPLFSEARAISRFAQELFLKQEVDQVDIVFPHFLSTLVQQAETGSLLPITDFTCLFRDLHAPGTSQPAPGAAATPTPAPIVPVTLPFGAAEFQFEPSAAQVFEALLPHSLNYRVYQILHEAKASEHSARMVAMKNATDNAQHLIRDLTLHYNQLRQAGITQEILEISSAATAAQ